MKILGVPWPVAASVIGATSAGYAWGEIGGVGLGFAALTALGGALFHVGRSLEAATAARRVAPAARELAPHDRDLLEQLFADLPFDFVMWLRSFDFGNSFARGRVDPLHDYMDRWRPPAGKARAPKLEATNARLYEAGRQLLEALLELCFSQPDGTLAVPREWKDLPDERFRHAVRRLNTLADRFAQAYDDVAQLAREAGLPRAAIQGSPVRTDQPPASAG